VPYRLLGPHLRPATVRGFILWLFGVAYIILGGIGYIGTDVPEPTRHYLAFALRHAPATFWGWVFVGVGLFACATAYRHLDQDRWGYTAASSWAAAWGMVYVCGWLFYDASPRAIGGSVLWFLFAAVLTTCARLPKVTYDDLAYDQSGRSQ